MGKGLAVSEKKAGTIILAASILMWALFTFPPMVDENGQPFASPEQQLTHSYAGSLGQAVEPLIKPLGGFDWKTGTALVAGFTAKEVVVSTMGGTLYSIEDAEALKRKKRGAVHTFAQKARQQSGHTPLQPMS